MQPRPRRWCPRIWRGSRRPGGPINAVPSAKGCVPWRAGSIQRRACRLDAAEAQVVVPKVLERIEKTTSFGQLNALGQGLSALAGKLDAAQAQAVVPKVLERIEKTTSSSQLNALGQGLSALAGKLD